MTASLTFLGAAGTVTGAKFLLETARTRVLIECGLFQGPRELRDRNWTRPAPATTIDAVVLSHAHLDHSGYLPRLARDGFRGPIHCSPGTADLLRILLPDAAHLEEEEAEFRTRTRATRYEPALPLFTIADAERALALVKPVAFGRAVRIAPGCEMLLRRSGHILGASTVDLALDAGHLVYSGDLGRYDVPVMRDPEAIDTADVLLVESTYGDRVHPDEDGTRMIVAAVERAVARRGWLLIPAFAVGRTQEILYRLRALERDGVIPRLAVYLDSPMGLAATAIYARHPEEHDEAATAVTVQGDNPFVPSRFHIARTVQDSKGLNDVDGPGIIVAGSGMATGGRILHHLRRLLPDDRTTVLFVGYQAAGTRGRALCDGAPAVRIFGGEVPVRAMVMTTDALSAHADQAEIVRWLGGFRRAPTTTYVVHGEPDAAEALRAAITKSLGWPVVVAVDGARVAI